MNISRQFAQQANSSMQFSNTKDESLKREQMLQQVVLDQKQRIRELERQLQISDSNNITVQRMKHESEIKQKNALITELNNKIMEYEEQLMKNKEYIMELLQLKEKEVLNVKQSGDYQRKQFEQEVLIFRQEYEQRLQEAENENMILMKQLEKSRTYPLQRALENYTSEEEYIRQIHQLQTFIATQENQYLAEIVHYKRAAELARSHMQDLLKLSEDEKKVLKNKLDEMKDVDSQVEKDVLVKFHELQQELKSISNELLKRNNEILQMKTDNYQNASELIEKNFDGEQIWLQHKAELEKQLKKTIQTYEMKIAFYEKEVQNSSQLKLVEVEKYVRENSVFIKENEVLQKALSDLKSLALSREQVLEREIEKYKKQTNSLIEASKNREKILEEEIKKLNFSVFQLHKAYESRETLFQGQNQFQKNQEGLIQGLIQKFDQLHSDMKNKMNDRKGGDLIKECKGLISKLGERLVEQDKLKQVNFEKRQSDRRANLAQVEKYFDGFVSICKDYQTRLEYLIDRFRMLGIQKEYNEEFQFTPNKQQTERVEGSNVQVAIQSTMSAFKTELDVNRYEQMLASRDAEIQLAKQNLVEFAKYYKQLEDKLHQKFENEYKKKTSQQLDEQMSLEQQEEMMIYKLNNDKEKLEMELVQCRLEIQSAQNENKLNSKKIEHYEQHFQKELRRIEEQYEKKINDLKNLVKFKQTIIYLKIQEQNNEGNRSKTPQQTIKKKSTIPNNSKNLVNTSISSSNSQKENRGDSKKFQELITQISNLKIQGEEIKDQLGRIEDNYLNNQRIVTLEAEKQNLQQRIDEMNESNLKNWNQLMDFSKRMEDISKFPTKPFQVAFNLFQEEIEKLVEIRISMEENSKTRTQFLKALEENYLALFDFENNSKPIAAKIHASLTVQTQLDTIDMLKKQLDECKAIQERERAAHRQELNIAVENLQQTLQVYEKKLDSANQESASLRKIHEDTQKNQQQLNSSMDKEIKHLRSEINNISKIISESQQKRMEERKKFIGDIQSIEERIVKKQEAALKLMEQKVKQISQIFDKKSRILQQRQNLQQHEQIIDDKQDEIKERQYRQQIQSMNEELQILRMRDKERDEQIVRQSQELNVVISAIKNDLQNLHQEKSQLIEEVDYLSQLLNLKEKSLGFSNEVSKKTNSHYYSFTENKQFHQDMNDQDDTITNQDQ